VKSRCQIILLFALYCGKCVGLILDDALASSSFAPFSYQLLLVLTVVVVVVAYVRHFIISMLCILLSTIVSF